MNYEPEHVRLEKLLQAMINQAENDLSDGTTSDITITVGCETVKLALGGPQIDGMIAMICHIAEENFYEVDLDKLTITG